MRNKCGKRRPKKNILDAEVKKREQDADRLLLVPRKNHRKRQVVDTATKGFGKSHRYLNSAVRIVALSHIHDTRQPTYGAKVKVVEAVFSASKRQHHAVGGRLLYKFGIVVTSRL